MTSCIGVGFKQVFSYRYNYVGFGAPGAYCCNKDLCNEPAKLGVPKPSPVQTLVQQVGAGNPEAGDSGAGNPGAGDSGAGDSGAGDSGAGDSGAGDSGAGDFGAGDTEVENVEAGSLQQQQRSAQLNEDGSSESELGDGEENDGDGGPNAGMVFHEIGLINTLFITVMMLLVSRQSS